MKILITGGSGFIGTQLLQELLKIHCDVTIFDKVESSTYPHLITIGDVRDKYALTKAMAGQDIVFHLAAVHKDDVQPVSLYDEVNVGGAHNLVAAAEETGCKSIIFMSSVAVYPLNIPDSYEDSQPMPFNRYGWSKYEAEKVFFDWVERYGDRTLVTVRSCVVFGEKNRGNVYNLLKQMAHGRFIMVGKGKNKKSMAYVGNVVAFLLYCMGMGKGNHLFNYADKPDLTASELVQLINQTFHRKGILTRVQIPYVIGLFLGYAFDVLAWMTMRSYPISSIRIKKFCADTAIATARLEETGFQRPFSLRDALTAVMEDEFGLGNKK